MSDEEARAIAGWARQLSVHFGRWQDIEWARRDGCLYLLQSRPITNLAGTPDSDAELTLWDNSNIVESYAGITTPLTFSFVRNVYRQVYQQFCAFMGVEPALIEENSTIFEMLGLMRGRIYYNLLNWYRALSLLPGYAINAEFMEQMMGVAEGFEIPPAPVPATRNRWLRLLRSAAGVLRAWRTLDREIAGFYRLVDAELARIEEHPLDTLTMHAVVARFERIESTLIANWRAPLVNDFFAMICFGALRKVITHWCTDLPVEFQNDLLTAEQSIVSTEPITRLSALAERCRAVPELAGATSPEDLLETIATHEALFAEFEALRERFGARTLEELKLETVTARQNPALLAGQLLAYIRQPIKPTDALANRLTAESAFLSVLRSPLRRRVGMWLLRHTRRRVAERENLRFQRTRVFDAARTLFIQLGRQLALDGALAQERDVFWLTKEEIFGFVRGTAIDTDLDTLVARRRSEWSAFADDAPSDRFETRGATCFANTFQGTASEIDCDAVDELAGLGCCPGVVSAEVVVVTDPRQCADLDGRILVAERTDPGWTPLFPLARGILVQRGSLLSHSAIVARELGIPAVVSIPGLTQQLKTGDLVTLNGSTGRVIVHRREALQEWPP